MNTKLTIATMFLCGAAMVSNAQQKQDSVSTIPFVYTTENTGFLFEKPAFLTADQMESCATLPDPFAWSNGSGRSEDFADWAKRRNEIKSEVEYYEIGVKPDVDRDQIEANYIDTTVVERTAHYDWSSVTDWSNIDWSKVKVTYTMDTVKRKLLIVKVTVGDSTATLTSQLTIPEGDGPFPVFISLGGSGFASDFPGCIQLSFNTDQVATYGSSSARYDGNISKQKDQFNSLYPELYDNGNYSKWAWGVSRLIDGLEIAKEKGQLNVDIEHIALSGCSYAGKMAMFCGAFDERVALTIAQEPGGGGASAWRTIDYVNKNNVMKKRSDGVEGLGNTNYSWFMASLQKFNGKADLLPHDHHEILAMCAPRALLVLGNTDMEWLCDYSTYITCRAAEKVYETFGIEDRFGFVIDGGHDHCSATTAERNAVKAFAAKFIFGDTTANTLIRTAINGRQYDIEDADYESWIEEWKPADPNRPNISIVEPASSTTYRAEDAPESVKFKAQVEDKNNDVAKVEFFVNGTVAKTVTAAPYEFELKLTEPGDYNVYAIATDATNLYKRSGTISIVVKTPEVGVRRTATAPKIDGLLDDIWANSEEFHAKNVVQGSIENEDDLSGYVQLLWNDTYIYAFATVFDNELKNDSGSEIYKDDNIELYFDCNNSKGGSYDSDDVQFSFNYGSTSIYTKSGSGDNTYSTEGIDFVIEPNPDGYNVEVAIPWATIKCEQPKEGLKIGFEFMIDDDDDGGDRDGKLAWNSTEDNAWQSSFSFGTVTLLGEGTAINEIEELDLTLYPNPASDFVIVDGIDGEFNYEILDIAGKIQAAGTANERISVAALPKGIYLVRIKDGILTRNLRFVKE